MVLQTRRKLRILSEEKFKLAVVGLVFGLLHLSATPSTAEQQHKQHSQAAQAAPPSSDYEVFTQLLTQHYADWTTPVNNPEKWYVPDALVFDLIPPLAPYRTREAYVAGALREFYDKMESVRFSAKDVVRVTRVGDVAWTEVIVHGSAKPKEGGASLELDVRQTLVWVKRDGKWLIAHEHNSVPMTSGK